VNEYRLKIRDFASTGSDRQKFQVKGVASTNRSSSQKTRINDLSYDIKNLGGTFCVLLQFTRLTDRQRDRRTDGQSDRFLVAGPRCMHACCVV